MTAKTTKIPMRWADGYLGRLDRCATCNRQLTAGHRYVEVIDGGANAAAADSSPDQSDPGYMGFFPVGRDCARKHFPGFTHKEIASAQTTNS